MEIDAFVYWLVIGVLAFMSFVCTAIGEYVTGIVLALVIAAIAVVLGTSAITLT